MSSSELQHSELLRETRRLRAAVDDVEASLRRHHQFIAQAEPAIAMLRREADSKAQQLREAEGRSRGGRSAALVRHSEERLRRTQLAIRAASQRVEGIMEEHAVREECHQQRWRALVATIAQTQDEQRVVSAAMGNVRERLTDAEHLERVRFEVFVDRCDARAAEYDAARAAAIASFREWSAAQEGLLRRESEALASYFRGKLDALQRQKADADAVLDEGDTRVMAMQREFENCRESLVRNATVVDRVSDVRAQLATVEVADALVADEVACTRRRIEALEAERDVLRSGEVARVREVQERIDALSRQAGVLQQKLCEVRRIATEARAVWALRLDSAAAAGRDGAAAQDVVAQVEFAHESHRRQLERELSDAAAAATRASDAVAAAVMRGNELQARRVAVGDEVRDLRRREQQQRSESSAAAQQLLRRLE